MVRGHVLLTPNAKQPFEVHASSIAVEGASSPEYPLQKKKHSLEYLRTIQHLAKGVDLGEGHGHALRLQLAADGEVGGLAEEVLAVVHLALLGPGRLRDVQVGEVEHLHDMKLAADMIKYILRYVMENCPQELKFFNSFYDKGRRPISWMRAISLSSRSSRWLPPMISPTPGTSRSTASTVFSSSQQLLRQGAYRAAPGHCGFRLCPGHLHRGGGAAGGGGGRDLDESVLHRHPSCDQGIFRFVSELRRTGGPREGQHVPGRLYNCAAVIQDGRILGVVPKRNIPGYGEFYETRN